MDISDAIARIQYHWRLVQGIRPNAAPDEPYDKPDPLPCVFTYDAFSEYDTSQMYSGSWLPSKGTIKSDLHLSRTMLAASIKLGRAMIKDFMQRLQDDPNLNGAIMITSPVRCQFMTFTYAGIDTIGWRVEIDYTFELTG